MTVYANLVDGEVKAVYDLLPSTWQDIEEFDKKCLSDSEFMHQNNFRKIVRDTTSYNPETHRMSDFPWYTVEDDQVIEHRDITEIPEPTEADLLVGIRFERDEKMKEFEWRYERYHRQVRIGIPTTDNIETLDRYMQALADVTEQEDLKNIQWPVWVDEE